jgi:hypothetical protein
MADIAQTQAHEHLDPVLRAQLLLGTAGGLLVGVAYLFLPRELRLVPNWLLLALNVVILGPIFVAGFFRPMPHSIARKLRTVLSVIQTLALASSLILYVGYILQPRVPQHGLLLLRSAALLWISNILIFALWYWEVDGDGPIVRHKRGHPVSDFLFPQQTRGIAWKAGFVDYVFLAFCFATALSPADTAPLTARAKLLMMGEAIASLCILVLLVARSVNIL